MSAYAGPSYMIGNCARVVGRVGLQGSAYFQVLDSDPETPSQEYPNNTDERVILRLKWGRAPGAKVIVDGLVLPCGMTQKYVVEPGSWIADIVDGAIIIDYTFTGPAGTVTDTTTIDTLPLSSEPFGALPTSDGACWTKMEWVSAVLDPYGMLVSNDELYDWSEGVTVEVTVKVRGGVRIVDLSVLEIPNYYYARDIGTDTNDEYYLPMVTNGAGNVVKAYPRDYPVSALTTTDPTYGTLLLADVNHRQHTQPGPILAQWGTWSDVNTPVTQLDVNAVEVTSMTFTSIPFTSLTDWRSTNPGWSVSSGGNAQQYKSSNAKRTLRNVNACVPVRIRVYAKLDGTSDATIRFQTENYSVAELLVSNSSYEWLSTTGHIRCGTGAEDESVLMAFGKVAGATDTLSVQHVVVEYLDL